MAIIIQDAQAAHADVALSVLKANPALRLYERLGFRVVGEDEYEGLVNRRVRDGTAQEGR